MICQTSCSINKVSETVLLICYSKWISKFATWQLFHEGKSEMCQYTGEVIIDKMRWSYDILKFLTDKLSKIQKGVYDW